jgi:hypothetical protein
MAVINYDELFDRLKGYIDTKVTESEQLLSELFEQHNMEQIGANITEVIKVGDNIEQVMTCAMGIVPIYVCARDIHNINAAPDAAQAALTAERGAENAQRLSSGFATQAWKWAQADEDAPVYDGEHHGFSAYHWAMKAQQQLSSYLPITGGTLTGALTIQNQIPEIFFDDTEYPLVDGRVYYNGAQNAIVAQVRDENDTELNRIKIVPDRVETTSEIYVNGQKVIHEGDPLVLDMKQRIAALEEQVQKLMMEKENGNH